MSLFQQEEHACGDGRSGCSAIEVLLREARGGSTVALGQLMDGCRKYLLAVAQRELDSDLRPKASASDLVQETFYEAHRDFQQFRGATELEFFAWITGIVTHRLANHARRYRAAAMRNVNRETPLEAKAELQCENMAAADATPGQMMLARDEEARLLVAMARLPAPLRRVLELKTWEGATFPQIGAHMHISADAARKQWGRALRRLRQEFDHRNES